MSWYGLYFRKVLGDLSFSDVELSHLIVETLQLLANVVLQTKLRLISPLSWGICRIITSSLRFGNFATRLIMLADPLRRLLYSLRGTVRYQSNSYVIAKDPKLLLQNKGGQAGREPPVSCNKPCVTM
jgi:hypothetical protein